MSDTNIHLHHITLKNKPFAWLENAPLYTPTISLSQVPFAAFVIKSKSPHLMWDRCGCVRDIVSTSFNFNLMPPYHIMFHI